MKQDQHLTLQGQHRRRLLTGCLPGGNGALVSQLPPVARPPQSLPEVLFSALCNGCGRCVSDCPYGLLSIEHGKAKLNIDFTECDFCLNCTSACQTGALRDKMPCDTLLRPQISPSCLGRQNNCRICIINCPQQALIFAQTEMGARQLQCDYSLCNGCGLCKLSCFHGHISLLATIEKLLPEQL